MAAGRKTGGRTKGTPNARTQDVIEKLKSLECDPIEGMARIAQQAEAEGDKSLAARMYTELAPYIAPKRKAIEHTVTDESHESREDMLRQIQELQLSVAQELIESLPIELQTQVQQHIEGTQEAEAPINSTTPLSV